MNTGAWLAMVGSALALVALNLGGGTGGIEGDSAWLRRLFSAVYIDEYGHSGIAGFQLWTGQLAIVAALAALGASWAVLKRRTQSAAWGLVASGAVQLLLAWVTFERAHSLVDCASLPGALCAEGGGLIPGTWLQLHGLVWLVAGGAMTALGGTLALLAPKEYSSDQQFLQLAMVWGDQVVSQRVFYQAQPVTIGEDRSNTWQVPADGLASHRLFAPLATDRYLLTVPAEALAWLADPSEEDPAQVRPITGELLVQRGQSGGLELANGVELRFAFVQAEPGSLQAGRHRRGEALGWSFGGVALAVWVLWVVASAQVPQAEEDATREELAQRNRGLIEVSVVVPEPPEVLPTEGQEKETSGKKAGGEEGRAGEPDVDPRRITKVPKNDAPMREKVDVTRIGVAAALSAPQGPSGALGNIMAGDTGAMASKLSAPSSGEEGAFELGHGSGGMGYRNTGSGGGGEGFGRIRGRAFIDTGGGHGREADIGMGRKAKARIGGVIFKEAAQTGSGCDKGDISKNVRSRAASLRACYEVQLSAHPTLSGKLTVQWTIASDGSTTGDRVVGDTLNSPPVSDCVLRAIRRIRFLAPEGGTCVVQWPFVFSPG